MREVGTVGLQLPWKRCLPFSLVGKLTSSARESREWGVNEVFWVAENLLGQPKLSNPSSKPTGMQAKGPMVDFTHRYILGRWILKYILLSEHFLANIIFLGGLFTFLFLLVIVIKAWTYKSTFPNGSSWPCSVRLFRLGVVSYFTRQPCSLLIFSEH